MCARDFLFICVIPSMRAFQTHRDLNLLWVRASSIHTRAHLVKLNHNIHSYVRRLRSNCEIFMSLMMLLYFRFKLNYSFELKPCHIYILAKCKERKREENRNFRFLFVSPSSLLPYSNLKFIFMSIWVNDDAFFHSDYSFRYWGRLWAFHFHGDSLHSTKLQCTAMQPH